MKIRVIRAGALVLAFSSNALAEEAANREAETVLDTILVTAGRTPVEQEKSGRAFTVITGETLARNQVRYVADALRQVPGFAVSRMGSYGGLTQLRVRGAEANHVLVMIDGVEASETSNGEVDFGGLQVADIERIEILRGPQSAFFGSNAVAGVVNIITKGGIRDGFKITGRTEAGTDGTFLGGVLMQGGGDNFDFALGGSYRQTDGFNVSSFGSEKDGDRNATFNGKFTVDVTPDFKIDGTLHYIDRKSDTDAQDYIWGSPTYGRVIDTDDQTATQEFVGSLGATWTALEGALTQKARITGNHTDREYFEHGDKTSGNKGGRVKAGYQATYAFDAPALADSRHQVTGGLEWQRETFRATPPVYDPSQLDRQDRAMNSFIGEYRGEFFDQLYFNAGVRHDVNEDFRDATTYSLSGSWKIPGTDTRLHSSVGTGVTNPTFYEQFGFIPSQFTGNPDLRPEESFGWDIGIEQGFFENALVVDVTYFRQNLENEITTVYAPVTTPVNQDGTSKRQGVEISATLNLFNGFTTTATYTYTDATDPDGHEEVRRPRHAGSLSMAYTFDEDRARVFAEAVFNGRMEDNAFVPSLPSRVTLDSYTVVNIGGSYQLNEHFEAFARIENLFDEEYQEVFDYNAAGRTAFIGMKGSF